MITEVKLPLELVDKLQRDVDPRPIVLMTCGISGSGKSTLSKHICSTYQNFVRLSIDGYIFALHGAYGTDYPASQYSAYQEEAEAALKAKLLSLLQDEDKKMNVILDFSFWSKEARDEWRALIDQGGGRNVLVFFKAEEEVLWKRIEERKKRKVDADSAAEITRETLTIYCAGFERPVGEGEIVISVDK